MKTLYISDLDGTLLNKEASLSEFTKETLNQLIQEGMLFTYATARSSISACAVTEGLNIKLPVIVYNGTFIKDLSNGEFLVSNYFGDEVKDLLDDLMEHDIYPIVYSYMNQEEKFTYLPEYASRGVMAHIHNRKGDKRTNPVYERSMMYEGEIFCINCIDEQDKLEHVYKKYKDRFHCVYYMDIYTHEWWLEMIPKTASKAGAVLMLKEHLGCDRLVVFGDQKNDIDMFLKAPMSIAMGNAIDELKEIATYVTDRSDSCGIGNACRHFGWI